MREMAFDIYRHPRHDVGVYHEAADFLASYQSPQYSYTLVLLDREWDGSPGNAASIRQAITGAGMAGRRVRGHRH